MKENVPVAQEATTQKDAGSELPAGVQEALGELAGAAQEGLMALSVGVGLGVLAELMDEEVEQVVGPKGRHDPERTAHRHGQEGGEVTLGGRRVAVERPRVRTADGSAEVGLETYRHFAERDALSRVRATNSRLTADFDVEPAWASTSVPTGSLVRSKRRVETPASICSHTSRVSGSRSAKCA